MLDTYASLIDYDWQIKGSLFNSFTSGDPLSGLWDGHISKAKNFGNALLFAWWKLPNSQMFQH